MSTRTRRDVPCARGRSPPLCLVPQQCYVRQRSKRWRGWHSTTCSAAVAARREATATATACDCGPSPRIRRSTSLCAQRAMLNHHSRLIGWLRIVPVALFDGRQQRDERRTSSRGERPNWASRRRRGRGGDAAAVLSTSNHTLLLDTNSMHAMREV